MYCECYQIGGSFIGADPDCPAHGTDGYQEQLDDAQTKVDQLNKEVERLKDQLDAAYDCHASECDKCRVLWSQLRKEREG